MRAKKWEPLSTPFTEFLGIVIQSCPLGTLSPSVKATWADLALQDYVKQASARWKRRYTCPESLTIASIVYRKFQEVMQLDPVALLIEAHKNQTAAEVDKVLIEYYERLIEQGYKASSAYQMLHTMRSFFDANLVIVKRFSHRELVPCDGKRELSSLHRLP